MQISNNQITENLSTIHSDIERIATEQGRSPDTVRVVAVSKTFPAAAVQAAYDAGQRMFGENRVQELTEKASETPADCDWHLVGHLQRNKVKHALQYANWIHSLDSVRLAERIDSVAGELETRPAVLIEVNVLGEESKYGVSFEEARTLLETCLDCSNFDIVGLMTIAPYGVDYSTLHRVFASLRELRDTLQAEFDTELPELSMGMSNDYEAAIQEGATIIRIGSAIFGQR